MKESLLVRAVRKAVKDRCPRAYVVKLADRFRRGVPDLLILFQSRLNPGGLAASLFVETKAPGGVASKVQQAEHARIRRAGGDVIVAFDSAGVLRKLSELGAIP